MSAWTDAMSAVVLRLLCHPESRLELVVLIFLLMAVGVEVLLRYVKSCGSTRATWGSMALVFGATLVLMVASSAATSLYVLPRVQDHFLAHWLPWAAALLSVIVVAAPLLCLTGRVYYLQSLIALAVTLVASAAVVLLTAQVFDSVRGGGGSMQKVIRRKNEQQVLF